MFFFYLEKFTNIYLLQLPSSKQIVWHDCYAEHQCARLTVSVFHLILELAVQNAALGPTKLLGP